MQYPQGHAVVRPRFFLPSPPSFSFSRRFLFNLVYWWLQVWFSPVIYLVVSLISSLAFPLISSLFTTFSYLVDQTYKLLYSKLAPYAIPPVEFLWRNKFNFLKAALLTVLYPISLTHNFVYFNFLILYLTLFLTLKFLQNLA
jgi:hypothetical protein